MSPDERRVVVVGAAGTQGREYLGLLPDGMQLAGLVDSDPRAAGTAEQYHVRCLPDVDLALSLLDFDLAIVAVPHHLHFDISRQLLAAGRHVIKEKPFALTTAKAAELALLEREQRVGLFTTVQRNYRATVRLTGSMLPLIGTPYWLADGVQTEFRTERDPFAPHHVTRRVQGGAAGVITHEDGWLLNALGVLSAAYQHDLDAGRRLSDALRDLAELVEQATAGGRQQPGDARTAPVPDSAVPAGVPPAPRNGTAGALRRSGNVWMVSYGDHVAHVPDRKGLRDLVRLLAVPWREVHCLDLLTGGGSGRQRAVALASHAPGTLGEVLDAPARAAYRTRIAGLRAELDEADARGDAEAGARAQAELDFLARELSAAYGLGGRPRVVGDPAERARTTVTWRIRHAIARITEAHPDLGQHLERSVRTGRYCAYEPGEPVDWQL